MSFQHQRIDVLHLLCHRSERYRTGDIGGSILILCSGIYQNQTFRLESNIRFRRRLIVNNGAMCLITGYRIKGNITEKMLLCTKRSKFAVDGNFSLSTSFHSRFEPSQELDHRHSVSQHCLSETRDFPIIFLCFHRWNRWISCNNLLTFHGFPQKIAGFIAIQKDIILGISLQSFSHLIIWIERNAVFSQISLHLVIDFSWIHIERNLLGGDEKITDEDRHTMNICATEIECPGDIIERRNEHSVGMTLAESSPDAGNFGSNGFTCKFHRLNFYRIGWDGRTICPNQPQRV